MLQVLIKGQINIVFYNEVTSIRCSSVLVGKHEMFFCCVKLVSCVSGPFLTAFLQQFSEFQLSGISLPGTFCSFK